MVRQENGFLEDKVFYALVIRDDMDLCKKLKQFIVDEGIQVVYQRYSFNPLYITERREDKDNE